MAKKIKLTAHVHVSVGSGGDISYSIFGCKDMTACGYVYVGPVEVEIDAPGGDDICAAEVCQLERKKSDIRAKMAAEIARIDRDIASLQALPA